MHRSTLVPLAAGSSKRVEERLMLRWPSVYRSIWTTVTRLSPGSPPRRALLVRIVRLGYAALARGDTDFLPVACAPDCVIYPDPRLLSDHDDAYRGAAGAQRLFDEWGAAFETWHWEPSELLDLGGERFVVRATMVVTGRTTGLEHRIEQWVTHAMRRGLIWRQHFCADEASALDALRDER